MECLLFTANWGCWTQHVFAVCWLPQHCCPILRFQPLKIPNAIACRKVCCCFLTPLGTLRVVWHEMSQENPTGKAKLSEHTSNLRFLDKWVWVGWGGLLLHPFLLSIYLFIYLSYWDDLKGKWIFRGFFKVLWLSSVLLVRWPIWWAEPIKDIQAYVAYLPAPFLNFCFFSLMDCFLFFPTSSFLTPGLRHLLQGFH